MRPTDLQRVEVERPAALARLQALGLYAEVSAPTVLASEWTRATGS